MEVEQTILSRSLKLIETLKTYYKEDENGIFLVVPENTNCTICSEVLKKNQPKNGLILTSTTIFNCTIGTGFCETCDESFSYQGKKDLMVNWNNKIIIAFELVQQYMRLYALNGTPFTCFIESRLEYPQYNQHSLLKKNINITPYLGYLHEAFVLFSTNVVFPQNTMKCCYSPKYVTMDGIVISIKTNKIPKFQTPWITGEINGRATFRRDRQLDPVSKEEASIIKNAIQTGVVTHEQYDELQNSDKVHVKVFLAMVRKNGELFQVPEEAKFFGIFLIKKVAAVVTLVPQTCLHIVKRYEVVKYLSL